MELSTRRKSCLLFLRVDNSATLLLLNYVIGTLHSIIPIIHYYMHIVKICWPIKEATSCILYPSIHISQWWDTNAWIPANSKDLIYNKTCIKFLHSWSTSADPFLRLLIACNVQYYCWTCSIGLSMVISVMMHVLVDTPKICHNT